MSSDDVAGCVLADVFGPRLIEDDYYCYQSFRDDFMALRLEDSEWTITEADVREWRKTYVAKANGRRKAIDGDAPPADPEEASATPTDQAAQHALVSWGNGITRARLLRVTRSVILVEGEKPNGTPLAPGAPLRVGLPGTPRMLPARLAAYGQANVFLVSLGSRAVRGASRTRVDLPAVVRSSFGQAPASALVVDLSTSGARLRGVPVPVGSECELIFVPPGRSKPVSLRCVAVRTIDTEDLGEVGVAFCGGALVFRIDRRAGATANG
jgi:hypothetical protein